MGPKAEKLTRAAFSGWVLLVFLAVNIAVGALRYGLPTVPYPAPLLNFSERHGWLVAHAVFASIALLAGPWQFLPGWRRRALTVHRWVGRVYCGAVAAGWVTSLPIAAHAQTGRVASAGFLLLGALWAGTTGAGLVAIYRFQVQAHRDWMIRSYALAAAAITLRLYLPIASVARVPFDVSYPVIAWLCWIPNLLFAEWLIRRSRTEAAEFSLRMSST